MFSVIKDKYLRAVFGLGMLILIVAFCFVYLKIIDVQTPLIIHFDAYKGIDFIGDKMDVFGILISSTIMIIINLFLANFLYQRERFLSYIFGFSSLGFCILILIATSVIISVN